MDMKERESKKIIRKLKYTCFNGIEKLENW